MFVGSVGRPDLVGSLGHTAEDMAKLMFNTLQTKILTLPDDVQVSFTITVLQETLTALKSPNLNLPIPSGGRFAKLHINAHQSFSLYGIHRVFVQKNNYYASLHCIHMPEQALG